MKRKFLSTKFLSILAMSSFIILLGLSINTTLSVWSSPERQFNVTPETVFINWTGNYKSNITISLNATDFSNATVEILNQTASFTENYTQENTQTVCQSHHNFLQVQNASGYYNNVVLNISVTNTTEVALIYANLQCMPGRYYIPILTINASVNENANISVIADIPINVPSTGTGSFKGSLPINSTYYHSYYFDTSSIENATGIAVNISWSLPQDIDLFLFDNSSTPLLKAKSINKSTTSESLLFNYLNYSNPGMWEIRIYGNSTSEIPYSGNIAFTTLNITNTSDPGQQISSIDFGVRNVTDVINFINITLKNEGNISLTDVVETKEFYHVKRFSGSGTQNFKFLVPDSSIASKVKVSLNWTGGSNYSFNLYNQNDVLLANSVNKHIYANFTGAMQEEYNETTSIPDSTGFWKVEVKNSTATADPYTLTIYIYPVSTWVTTNYTAMTFNRSNYTDVHINVTIPTTALNGSYEGYLQYLDNRNAGIRIPIKVDVTTPMLVVNNTMNSLMYRIDENYGVDLTRSLYFNISNLGFYDLNVNFPNSTNLTCTTPSTCSGYNASLSFNTTPVVFSNNWNLTQVNITFNSSMPVGSYEGWITINGTNDPIINSRPYTNFTINLKLNLTNLLDTRIYASTTPDGDNVVGNASGNLVPENVTQKVKVFYINGTEIEAGNALNTSNFAVWLVEKNVSYRIPSESSLTLFNGTNPLYFNENYHINSTVPANQPGGIYEVHVSTSWTRSDGKSFTGEGVNRSTLIINNTGLHMSSNITGCSFGSSCSTSFEMDNNTARTIYVNVTNFGPLAASSAKIKFDRGSCTGYSVAVDGLTSGCSGTGTGDTSTISPSAYSSSCIVWWTITAGSSAASACKSSIIGDTANKWFNPYGINVTITVTAPEEGLPPENYTPPTYVASLAFTKADSFISVQQNSSNSTTVEVKNTGNITQNITFSILNISSTWYTINSTSVILAVNKTAGFLVTFSVGNEEIKDYSGIYKAESPNKTITSSFTLRVLPSEASKAYTNSTLAAYRQNMNDLSTRINQLKAQGYNVDLAEAKLSELRVTIEQAENYIAQGDYFSAYQLLSSIKSLLEQTKEELSKAQKEEKAAEQISSYITYALIAAGIVGAIILAYLFWPTKPYKPREEVWERLREKWELLGKKKEEKKPEGTE
ncbi:MAG: hypothetical protein QMD12_01535 [Candidatus Aenigmarchaeota archaeon]|nr:hypothetical protein [Candidatus Aenigmarchaeota archaeon]